MTASKSENLNELLLEKLKQESLKQQEEILESLQQLNLEELDPEQQDELQNLLEVLRELNEAELLEQPEPWELEELKEAEELEQLPVEHRSTPPQNTSTHHDPDELGLELLEQLKPGELEELQQLLEKPKKRTEREQLPVEHRSTPPQNTSTHHDPDELGLELVNNLAALVKAAKQKSSNRMLSEASLVVWSTGIDFAKTLVVGTRVSDQLQKKIKLLSNTIDSVTKLLADTANFSNLATVTKNISKMYEEMSAQYPVKKRANPTKLLFAFGGAVFTLAGIFCVALAVIMPPTTAILAVCLYHAALLFGMGAYSFNIASTAGKDSANTSMHRNVTGIYKSLLDVSKNACEAPLDKTEAEAEAKSTRSP